MKLEQIFAKELFLKIHKGTVLGIDLGSRTAKAALFHNDSVFFSQTPTGLNTADTVEELLNQTLEDAGITRKEIEFIVGTGYGRVALSFPDIPFRIVTEISCHATGAHFLDPGVQTLIDIGGQDSKAIRIDPATGKVSEFAMNDKCAAGTGRFLEKVAALLEMSISELGQRSLESKTPCPISSTCVVFAESEIISLRARGYAVDDIAAGVHAANAQRIRTLLSRLTIVPNVFFSGGVANNAGMKKAIEDAIGVKIKEPPIDAIFAGALGAAILAANERIQIARSDARETREGSAAPELRYLGARIKERLEFFAADKKQKKAGYLCSYTPLEILSAAGLPNIRLYQAGSSDEVSSGELVTQSVFCDLTKSIIGKFKLKDPVYTNLSRVYTFFTCDCMKKTAEAINELYKPSSVYVLPRIKDRDLSRKFYRDQIIHFREDVETLAGRRIRDEDLKEEIHIYNRVRSLLREISSLRKRPDPPISGSEFLELINAYYYVPTAELLPIFQSVYDNLKKTGNSGVRPIRLMLSGGIVADGDRKIMNLAENFMGARVVVEDHCSGLKIASTEVSETGDPYKALADGYLDHFPCTRMKPLEERIKATIKMARDYQVEGVLYSYLKFCPCYGLTKNQFLRAFQEAGIPVLEVPTDYSRSDEGQIRTRLEAFVEVLLEGRAEAISA
jgi:predicted CoA-substrate-specific enzyme activase